MVMCAGWRVCLPAPRGGPPGSPLRSLRTRPLEIDTHQGESHGVEENHRPGDLFLSPGPAIKKLDNLGQVPLSPSSSCKMLLDSDS